MGPVRRTAKKRDTRTDAQRKDAFIEELRGCYSVFHAAKRAGVGRTTVYEWRASDGEFAKRWDGAVEDAADTLEASLFERAVKGVEEPVFQGGKKVGTRRTYSDTAAIFLLKGGRPEKYRDQLQHSGPAGGPIPVAATHAHVQVTDERTRAQATAAILARLGLTGGPAAPPAVDPADE